VTDAIGGGAKMNQVFPYELRMGNECARRILPTIRPSKDWKGLASNQAMPIQSSSTVAKVPTWRNPMREYVARATVLNPLT
jgi:hypothetical protein